MEELAKKRANSEVLNSIVKEHQRLIAQEPSNDHSGEASKVEEDSDYRNSSTVSDDGSFEILDFETEAGVKTCAPGKKRKTSADGPGFVTLGKTSDFSNESLGGDEGERDSDEYPSRGGGDGNKYGQHWHPREPDSRPKRFAFVKHGAQVYILLIDCNVREVPDPYIDVIDAFCDESDDGQTSADESLEDIAPNPKETSPQPTTDAQEFGEFEGERLALTLRSTMEQLFAEFHGRSEALRIRHYAHHGHRSSGNNAAITSSSVSFPHSISPSFDASRSEYKQKPKQPTEPDSKLELLNARAFAIDVGTESHHIPRDVKDPEILPDSVDSWFYPEIMNPGLGDLDFYRWG
ncbi:hypothetical protein K440DRAFT_645554 [Wilcoxina mikolae CBS 423.85]|nr:hypothetical protein K440DRAFT_645554 [Wilcoxina mikolae CBS 423.85]